MRTKHVLLALAVPMAFAACTQEEFESNTGIQSDLGNRPVVGQISFYTGDGLATRLANPETGAIEFADGDQFGMVLMDNVSSGQGNANIGDNKYDLANNAYTNYPFTKNGNVWTSEAELVEGNYFYYMPYTNNQTDATKTRVTRNGGLQWVISASQNAYTAAEPTKVAPYNAVKDNQLYIGYEMLNSKEPATKLEAKMLPVHGTIQFNLKNSEATAFSVKRIVLAGDLPLTGSLNVKDGKGNLTEGTYTDAEGKGNEANLTANIADIFRLYNEALSEERADFTKNPLMMGNSTSFLSQSENNSIALNFPSNTVVAQGQTLTASMVVPACIPSVPTLTATVYTDRGIMTLPITVGSYLTGVADGSGSNGFIGDKGVVAYKTAGSQDTPDATITLYVRDEDEQTEYEAVAASNSFSKIRPEEWNAVGINFGATAIQIPGKMEIYTTEDLNDFMNYCKLNPNVAEDETEIEAIIKAKGVELTAEAYKVLADNEKIKLTISGTEALVIPAGLSNDVLTRLTWATTGAQAIVKGEQTIAAANTSLNNLTLTNEGTLTVNYVDNKNAAQNTTLANLYNLKNATISTPLTTVTALINGASSASADYKDILADAQLTVKANVTGTSTNFAKITVEGNVEIGALTNEKVKDSQTSAANEVYKTATVTVAENATLKTSGEWNNKGDITVNGVLTAGAAFTNAADANIYNNYGIENVQGVTFTNAGYIKVAANAKFTTISENSGEVEIMARSTEIEAGTTSGDGRVSYTAVASDMTSNTFTYSDSDNFTTLKIGASNVTIASTTKAESLKVEVTADGTYKFSLKESGEKEAKDSKLKALQVNENVYMTIASSVTVSTTVDIKEGATIQNNSGCIFTFDASSGFNNNGTFRNIGELKADDLTKPLTGNFTGSGTYPASWKN